MNKEDLIKKYENLEGVWNANGAEIARQCFLRDLEQLNEIDMKKVTVPQFVADWYEKHKNDFEFAVFNYLYMFDKQDESDFKRWFRDSRTEPFQILVSMLQFGYEVEKEKRYTVRMRVTKQPLFYNNMYEKIFFSLGELATQFTRKELEEVGLGWVFDCPGVEVEEVEG